MQRDNLLHELDILHQPDHIVREELDGRHRSDTARVQSRRVNMTALHQAEHLTGHAAHLQRLKIERTVKGFRARMMSAMVLYPCSLECAAFVFSAFASTLGLVSLTICSQKSTPTRLS